MPGNLLSVLLVDDDQYAGDIFRLIMEHHSVPFVVVENADAALEYLKTRSPDVIMLDLFLPGMDGYRALDAIRNLPHIQDCKIVATTSYYTAATQHEVMQRGFDGYIPKPFVPNELVAYLEKLASGTRQ
jgi:CheY-like chemotaxis protein